MNNSLVRYIASLLEELTETEDVSAYRDIVLDTLYTISEIKFEYDAGYLLFLASFIYLVENIYSHDAEIIETIYKLKVTTIKYAITKTYNSYSDRLYTKTFTNRFVL